MVWLSVAAGGALGSILRYALGIAANMAGWPWGTWLANIIGSFCMGLFFVWGKDQWPTPTFLLFTTGLLGGFTTFSTFSLETITFFMQGQVMRGVLYALTSVGIGLIAACAGIWLGRYHAW
jgi:CrcB protein